MWTDAVVRLVWRSSFTMWTPWPLDVAFSCLHGWTTHVSTRWRPPERVLTRGFGGVPPSSSSVVGSSFGPIFPLTRRTASPESGRRRTPNTPEGCLDARAPTGASSKSVAAQTKSVETHTCATPLSGHLTSGKSKLDVPRTATDAPSRPSANCREPEPKRLLKTFIYRPMLTVSSLTLVKCLSVKAAFLLPRSS